MGLRLHILCINDINCIGGVWITDSSISVVFPSHERCNFCYKNAVSGTCGVLAFYRECSGLGHWGWRIIYVKLNSEAFLF